MADADGELFGSATATVPQDERTTVEVVVTKRMAPLTGMVECERGRAMSGARVWAEVDGQDYAATADGDGRYCIQLRSTAGIQSPAGSIGVVRAYHRDGGYAEVRLPGQDVVGPVDLVVRARHAVSIVPRLKSSSPVQIEVIPIDANIPAFSLASDGDEVTVMLMCDSAKVVMWRDGVPIGTALLEALAGHCVVNEEVTGLLTGNIVAPGGLVGPGQVRLVGSSSGASFVARFVAGGRMDNVRLPTGRYEVSVFDTKREETIVPIPGTIVVGVGDNNATLVVEPAKGVLLLRLQRSQAGVIVGVRIVEAHGGVEVASLPATVGEPVWWGLPMGAYMLQFLDSERRVLGDKRVDIESGKVCEVEAP